MRNKKTLGGLQCTFLKSFSSQHPVTYGGYDEKTFRAIAESISPFIRDVRDAL